MTYVLVENAGYEGEFEWPYDFTSEQEAWDFAGQRYEDNDEIHKLHVVVAKRREDGGLTYDF